MNDREILELFLQRDEKALIQMRRQYGALCETIAFRILSDRRDAEECVSDALRKAWESIPPLVPENLKAWLCKVTRNFAINRYDAEHSLKRDPGALLLLSELKDVVPSANSTETEWENREISRLINDWLRSLPREDRILFVRRYFFGTSLKDIAKKSRTKPEKLAQKLFRLRKSLKNLLEKEGVQL